LDWFWLALCLCCGVISPRNSAARSPLACVLVLLLQILRLPRRHWRHHRAQCHLGSQLPIPRTFLSSPLLSIKPCARLADKRFPSPPLQ
jgi:hypothetical protein